MIQQQESSTWTEVRFSIPARMSFRRARDELRRLFESAYLAQLWKECGGNISLAARISGLDRKTVRHLFRRYQSLSRTGQGHVTS